MKYNRNAAIFAVIIGMLFAFTYPHQEIKHLGEPTFQEGVLIYHFSKPTEQYDYLGTYKVGMIWKDTPDLLIKKLIRKTKSDFPTLQAIIVSDDMQKCDAIKFK